MVVTGADYNRLQNYKITKFTAFVSGDAESGDRSREVQATLLTFEGERDYQNWTSANKGRGESKFGRFCDNTIIECPQTL